MVKSNLDKTIEYAETKERDKEDIGFDANLYDTEFYGIKVFFVIGNPKYTYLDNNIIYYPIYWVKDEKITTQIGLYELLAGQQQSIFDADGDIDLNKLDKPLLYGFTYGLLAKSKSKKSKTTNPKTQWINTFMQGEGSEGSDNYNIIDTKYDGDCFFSVLKLALEENEQPDISIADMREIVASNATETVFAQYKTLYNDYNMQAKNLSREIKNVVGRLKTMKTQTESTKDHHLKQSLLKQSKDIKTLNDNLRKDQEIIKEALEEVAFMEGIESLAMLKLKIKTQEFWADTWAISTLERELNLKTIIFSERNYRDGDEMNVLQCGQLNDDVIDDFEPSFYVLVCHYGGFHYQMITYNEEKIFTYEELPAEVKKLVVDKCLERIAGPYSIIPEFRAAALGAAAVVPAATTAVVSAATASFAAAAPDSLATATASLATASLAAPATEELSSDLYDNTTVFRFYHKSADKPFPGKGQGELLGPEGRDAYSDLAKIPEWRRKLSNFWLADFKLDGHKWASVEHYYQGAKFKKNNKDFYIKFSLDSPDSSIAKDPALAKAAGGKSGKFKGEQVRPKNVVLDPDFFTKADHGNLTRAELEMETAMRAKFTQHDDLKKLLLATKKAKLEHVKNGRPPEVYNNLMRVRREFKTFLP